MTHHIILNIAGEKFEVDYDGYDVYFAGSNELAEFQARCGSTIDQEMLVKICEQKINEDDQ